jgi:DNA-binding transcriptional MocR family regulator
MRLGAGWVSTLLQRLVVELWQDTDVAEGVRSAATSYGQRRDALREALAAHGLAARGRTGINVWVPVPDETAAVAALRDCGWAVGPGAVHRLASAPGLRLTVSRLRLSDVDAVAAAVATAVGPGSPGARY